MVCFYRLKCKDLVKIVKNNSFWKIKFYCKLDISYLYYNKITLNSAFKNSCILKRILYFLLIVILIFLKDFPLFAC
jgi:hypothetical protein